jgi:L-ascorbate metabolism protein UlaG (beta-lactamase superfamily)
MNLQAKEITFKWFGQACFLIVTSNNTKIITDPVTMGDYSVPKEIKADIVTVSHEHFDHNKVEAVSGNPIILRGLTSGAKEFAKIDRTIKNVRIYTVPSYHDKVQGKKRGLNAVFVFEFDGIRVAHLGDLGETFSNEQINKIGKIDVLMIPVGGKYTIYGKDADMIISQLKPKLIVFPMHFKTDVADFLPYSANDFVKGKENIKRIDGNYYKLDLNNLPKKLEYVILNYK